MSEITDIEGLKIAIRAAGRTADGNEARANVIDAARRLGHGDLVPDSWAEDGSLRGAAWSREQRETYNDTFTALNGAVSDAVDDDWYCWVQDFTDTEVIFYAMGDLWSVGYTLEPGGAVTLTGDPAKVRPVTSYVARNADPQGEYRRERAGTLADGHGAKPTADEREQRNPGPSLEFRQRRATMLRGTTERREFEVGDLECRTLSDGTIRMSGYASVTEHSYEIGDAERGGFYETIRRQAFKRTLSESPDVVLLANHGEGGSGLPLARTKNDSLSLGEDARGLRWTADLDPEDPESRVLARKVEQRLLDECSFAFRCTDDEWDDTYTHRTIKGVSLHKGDVSVVNYGANEATSVSTLRSDDGSLEVRAGRTLSAANEAALKNALNLVAAADDAVDKAQPILADVLGIANPDADDEPDADDARAAEPVKPVPLPDHTTRAKERLARLRRTA